MKNKTLKAHKKAAREDLRKILIKTSTKVIKNKKKDHRSKLENEDL